MGYIVVSMVPLMNGQFYRFPVLYPTASLPTYSAFTLPTSELCQTGLVSFSKADVSRLIGTWQVSVVLLISAFENETKPVWHSSEVGSVNTLLAKIVSGIS